MTEYKGNKILETKWYQGVIGIVTIEDKNTLEIKRYIGIGDGFDEKEDIKRILDWGSRFYL